MTLKWFLYIAVYSAIFHCGTTRDENACEDTIFLNGHRYVKETLIDTNDGLPADISVDWKTGNIFYCVNHGNSIRLYILRNGTVESVEVTGIPTVGPSTTIDQTNGIVYIATNDGLYTYDDATTSGIPFGAKGSNIAYAYVADKGKTIYYLTMDDGQVYKLPVNSKVELFDSVPYSVGLVVDGKNNFYYSKFNNDSIFKHGNSLGVSITNLTSKYINHFYVDKSDSVWVVTHNSDVYKVDGIPTKLQLVGNLGYDFIHDADVDFDDNIIVGVYKGLKILKKVNYDPCV